MTVIAAFAICGAIFAQTHINPNGYEAHWAFDSGLYEDVDYPVAHIKANDAFVEQDGNWADLEIASFVGNDIRGHAFLTDEWIEYGWPHPLVELPVNYNNTGETVSFKIYDHATGIEYDATCNITILTGEEHTEIYMWDWDNAVVLTYVPATTETVTVSKEIIGYGADNANSNTGYYLIASPIEGINPDDVAGMTSDIYDLYAFSDAVDGQEWVNYKATPRPFETLAPGTGYLYALQETNTISFTGTLCTTTEVTLQKTDGTPFSGWNLVGNPFNGRAYITKEFYRMNATGNELVAPGDDENFLNVMEGVFVLADNDGETLTFSTSSSKGAQVNLNVVQGNTLVDRAVVSFGKNRSLPKFQLNPNHTKVYIPVDSKDFAVVSAENQGEMPVNFKAEANGTYTIGFSADNVAFGYLHLIDNLTGNDVDLLASPTYTFDATTSDYASRFRLVFATSDLNDDQFAFISNGNIILNGVDGNTNVQLFDVTGRMVCSSNGAQTIATNHLAAGVYMVQLVNGSNVKSQKIVVK